MNNLYTEQKEIKIYADKFLINSGQETHLSFFVTYRYLNVYKNLFSLRKFLPLSWRIIFKLLLISVIIGFYFHRLFPGRFCVDVRWLRWISLACLYDLTANFWGNKERILVRRGVVRKSVGGMKVLVDEELNSIKLRDIHLDVQ